MPANIPNARLSLVTAPSVEVVTLDTAKAFLKVDFTADDALISDMIVAARQHVEGVFSTSLVYSTWKLTLDYFPTPSLFTGILPIAIAGAGVPFNTVVNLASGSIGFPLAPLVAVTSIRYRSSTGAWATIDPSSSAGLVEVSTGSPGFLSPAYGTVFPMTLPVPGAVEIEFQVGYSADASLVPKSAAQAIRALLAHYYYHRTDGAAIPDAIYNLAFDLRWTF